MAETAANHKQYQQEHIGDNKTPTIVGVYSLGFVLAVTAVGLRFFSRKVSDLPYLADDWVILAALVCIPRASEPLFAWEAVDVLVLNDFRSFS